MKNYFFIKLHYWNYKSQMSFIELALVDEVNLLNYDPQRPWQRVTCTRRCCFPTHLTKKSVFQCCCYCCCCYCCCWCWCCCLRKKSVSLYKSLFLLFKRVTCWDYRSDVMFRENSVLFSKNVCGRSKTSCKARVNGKALSRAL